MGRLHARDERCEHEGFTVGYVPRDWQPQPIDTLGCKRKVAWLEPYTARGVLREVGLLEHNLDIEVRGICVIGLGCACGWRSPYYELGTQVDWSPCITHAPEWLEDRLSAKWWTPHVEAALRLEPEPSLLERLQSHLIGDLEAIARQLIASPGSRVVGRRLAQLIDRAKIGAPNPAPASRSSAELAPVDDPQTHDRAVCDCLDCENWRAAEASHAEPEQRYRCASPACPGYSYRASQFAHPADTCGSRPAEASTYSYIERAPEAGVRLEVELEPKAAAALLALLDELGMSHLNWLLARDEAGRRLEYRVCSMVDPQAPTVDPACDALAELDRVLRRAIE
jgi:hypothetical protein